MRRQERQAGYTLLELMVTVLIVFILLALIVIY